MYTLECRPKQTPLILLPILMPLLLPILLLHSKSDSRALLRESSW